MTITKNCSRQEPGVAFVDISLADIADGTAQGAIQLPAGAIVIRGKLLVTEVFNAGTTAVLNIGDALAANRYADGLDLRTLGVKELAMTGYVVPQTSDLTVTYVPAGAAATAGKARLFVEYIGEKKTEWTQG